MRGFVTLLFQQQTQRKDGGRACLANPSAEIAAGQVTSANAANKAKHPNNGNRPNKGREIAAIPAVSESPQPLNVAGAHLNR